MARLQEGGNWSMRDWMVVGEMGEKNAGIDSWSWEALGCCSGNLVQGKFSGIYEGDFSENFK